jgi:reverse gyrase
MPSTQKRAGPGIHPRLLEPLRRELVACRDDLNRYNERILCRAPYWRLQAEVARSVVQYPTTVVVTGNGVGKSYFGASVPPWFATTRKNSKVVVAAPTIDQLQNVLWSEMEAAALSAAAHGRPIGRSYASQ